MMTVRLKEKIIISSDPTTEIIISAKSEMGKPHIIALFLMFLYISYFFIRLRLK